MQTVAQRDEEHTKVRDKCTVTRSTIVVDLRTSNNIITGLQWSLFHALLNVDGASILEAVQFDRSTFAELRDMLGRIAPLPDEVAREVLNSWTRQKELDELFNDLVSNRD